MDKRRVKELEARLWEMFELNEKVRTKQERKQHTQNDGANVVIRRRKGEKDKRILLNPSS